MSPPAGGPPKGAADTPSVPATSTQDQMFTNHMGRYATRMWRNWIIRGMFLGLLAIVIGWWVDSFWHVVDVAHTGSRTVLLITARGFVRVYSFEKPFTMGGYTHGFEAGWFASDAGFETRDYLGFALGHVEQIDPTASFGRPLVVTNRYWEVGMPFWFLALLAAFVTFYAWRRTRANKGRCNFPVETDGPRARNV
jgi:hypothetical protein